MSKDKQETAARIKRVRSLLRAAGYDICQEHVGNLAYRNSYRIVIWAGPRGTIICQEWEYSGVDIYHTSGVPTDWEEFKTWLTNEPMPTGGHELTEYPAEYPTAGSERVQ